MNESYECMIRHREDTFGPTMSCHQNSQLEDIEAGMVDVAAEESVDHQPTAESTTPQPITPESSSTPPPITTVSSSTRESVKAPLKLQEPAAWEEPETLEEQDNRSNGSNSHGDIPSGEEAAYQERSSPKDPSLSARELKLIQTSSQPTAQSFRGEARFMNTPPDSHEIKTEYGVLETLIDDSSNMDDVKPKIEVVHDDWAEESTCNDDEIELDYDEGVRGVKSRKRGGQREKDEFLRNENEDAILDQNENEDSILDDHSELNGFKVEKANLDEYQTGLDLGHGKNGVISRKRKRRRRGTDEKGVTPLKRKRGRPKKTITTVSHSNFVEDDDDDDDDDDSFWRVSEVKLDAQNSKDKKERRDKGITKLHRRKCRFCFVGKNDDSRLACFRYKEYTYHKLVKHNRKLNCDFCPQRFMSLHRLERHLRVCEFSNHKQSQTKKKQKSVDKKESSVVVTTVEDVNDDDEDDSFWRVSEEKLDAQHMQDLVERKRICEETNLHAKDVPIRRRKCRLCPPQATENDDNYQPPTYGHAGYKSHKSEKHGRKLVCPLCHKKFLTISKFNIHDCLDDPSKNEDGTKTQCKTGENGEDSDDVINYAVDSETSLPQKDLVMIKKPPSKVPDIPEEALREREKEKIESLVKHDYYTQHKHLAKGFKERMNQILQDGIIKDYSAEALLFLHSRYKQLIKRRRTTNSALKFDCKLCGKKLLRCGYKHAFMEHGAEYKDTCPICLEGNLNDLEGHYQQTHFGNIPLKCNTCPEVRYWPRDLHNHIVSHTTAEKFTCKMSGCGFNFYNKEQLEKHKLTHQPGTSGRKAKTTSLPAPGVSCEGTCETCGRVYKATTEDDLTKKIKAHKQQSSCGVKKKLKCPHCPKEYWKMSVVKEHIAQKHSDDEPYACPFMGCNKTFKTRGGMVGHQIYHRPPKFQCEKCSKPYYWKEYYDIHIAKCQVSKDVDEDAGFY